MLGFISGCTQYVPRPIEPQKSLEVFRARSLAAPDLRAFLAGNGVQVPPSGVAWSMKALTLAAFYYQPSLAEARAQLLAAQAARITAAERPNPSIAITPGYDSGVPNAPSPWIVPISMDWPIETAGRRGDRMEEARHLAVASRWDLVGKVWQVRSGLRTALLGLYAARRTESLLRREELAQRRIVKLTEGQIEAGMGPGYLLTQARIELDRTTLARQAAAAAIHQAKIRLAAAIGVAPRALSQVRFSYIDFERFPRDLTRPQIRRQALLGRADVRAALERYAASQSALKLEVARQWPNLHLGPGFAWNSQLARDSEWQLGLSLPLPLLNHNQGPIAEARAKRKLAAAHFLTVQADALDQIDSALERYHAALTGLATADALLAHLQQQLDSMRALVRAGERQPLDLAEAEFTFDIGARRRLEAQIRAQQALGELESAVQSPLTLASSTLRAAQTGTSNPEKP